MVQPDVEQPVRACTRVNAASTEPPVQINPPPANNSPRQHLQTPGVHPAAPWLDDPVQIDAKVKIPPPGGNVEDHWLRDGRRFRKTKLTYESHYCKSILEVQEEAAPEPEPRMGDPDATQEVPVDRDLGANADLADVRFTYCKRQLQYLESRVGLQGMNDLHWEHWPPPPRGVPADDPGWKRASFLGLGSELTSLLSDIARLTPEMIEEIAEDIGEKIRVIRAHYAKLADRFLALPEEAGDAPFKMPPVRLNPSAPPKIGEVKVKNWPTIKMLQEADEREDVVEGIGEALDTIKERAIGHGKIIQRDDTVLRECQDASGVSIDALQEQIRKLEILRRNDSIWKKATMLLTFALAAMLALNFLITIR